MIPALSFFVDPANLKPNGANRHFGEVLNPTQLPGKTSFRVRTELEKCEGPNSDHVVANVLSITNAYYFRFIYDDNAYFVGKISEYDIDPKSSKSIGLQPYYDLTYLVYKTSIYATYNPLIETIDLEVTENNKNFICDYFDKPIYIDNIMIAPFEICVHQLLYTSPASESNIAISCITSHHDLHKVDCIYNDSIIVDRLDNTNLTSTDKASILHEMDVILNYIPLHSLLADYATNCTLWKYSSQSQTYTTEQYYQDILTQYFSSVKNEVYAAIYDQTLKSTQVFSHNLINDTVKILNGSNEISASQVGAVNSQWPIAKFDMAINPISIVNTEIASIRLKLLLRNIDSDSVALIESSNVILYKENSPNLPKKHEYYAYPTLNQDEMVCTPSQNSQITFSLGRNFQSPNSKANKCFLTLPTFKSSGSATAIFTTSMVRIQLWRNDIGNAISTTPNIANLTKYQARLSILLKHPNISNLTKSVTFKSKKLTLGRNYYSYTSLATEKPQYRTHFFYCGNQVSTIGINGAQGQYPSLDKSAAFFTQALMYRNQNGNPGETENISIVSNVKDYRKGDITNNPNYTGEGETLDFLKFLSRSGFLSYTFFPAEILTSNIDVNCKEFLEHSQYLKDTRCIDKTSYLDRTNVEGFSGMLPSINGFILAEEEITALKAKFTNIDYFRLILTTLDLTVEKNENSINYLKLRQTTGRFRYIEENGTEEINDYDMVYATELKYLLSNPSNQFSGNLLINNQMHQENLADNSTKSFIQYHVVNNLFDFSNVHMTHHFGVSLNSVRSAGTNLFGIGQEWETFYLMTRLNSSYLHISNNINGGVIYFLMVKFASVRKILSVYFSRHYGTHLLIDYKQNTDLYGSFNNKVNFSPFNFSKSSSTGNINLFDTSKSNVLTKYEHNDHLFSNHFANKCFLRLNLQSMAVNQTNKNTYLSFIHYAIIFLNEVGTFLHEVSHGLALMTLLYIKALSNTSQMPYIKEYLKISSSKYTNLDVDLYDFVKHIKDNKYYLSEDHIYDHLNQNHNDKYCMFERFKEDIRYAITNQSQLSSNEVVYLVDWENELNQISPSSKTFTTDLENILNRFKTYNTFRDWNHNYCMDVLFEQYLVSPLSKMATKIIGPNLFIKDVFALNNRYDLLKVVVQHIALIGYDSTQKYRQLNYYNPRKPNMFSSQLILISYIFDRFSKPRQDFIDTLRRVQNLSAYNQIPSSDYIIDWDSNELYLREKKSVKFHSLVLSYDSNRDYIAVASSIGTGFIDQTRNGLTKTISRP